MNCVMPVGGGGAESSMMDSSSPYSLKQSGLLTAVEIQPDIEKAKALGDRFEANKVGAMRGHNRVRTTSQIAGRQRIIQSSPKFQ